MRHKQKASVVWEDGTDHFLGMMRLQLLLRRHGARQPEQRPAPPLPRPFLPPRERQDTAESAPEHQERQARRAEKAAAFELERCGSSLRTRDVLWALSWLVAAAWRVLLWIDGAQVRSEFWSSMLLGALDLYIAAYAAWAATMCGFLQVVVGWRGGKQERGGGA